MVIEVFAMESALLRAIKTLEKLGDEKSQIQKAMVRVYVNDSFERVKGLQNRPYRQLPKAIHSGHCYPPSRN